jgi:hypothetical protein
VFVKNDENGGKQSAISFLCWRFALVHAHKEFVYQNDSV